MKELVAGANSTSAVAMPAARIARCLAAVSVLLTVAHVVVLFHFGRTPPGPLLSNFLQLLICALTTAVCYIESARARDFVRQFWFLTGTGFLCWVFGQAAWIYYEEVLKVPVIAYSPLTLPLFFFVGPMVMALFLTPDFRTAGVHWARVIDFLQVGLVCLTA